LKNWNFPHIWKFNLIFNSAHEFAISTQNFFSSINFSTFNKYIQCQPTTPHSLDEFRFINVICILSFDSFFFFAPKKFIISIEKLENSSLMKYYFSLFVLHFMLNSCWIQIKKNNNVLYALHSIFTHFSLVMVPMSKCFKHAKR
jgi:hypothetical protein